MSSTPTRRTKFKHNRKSDVASKGDYSDSSSTLLLKSIKEPPRDFFPSKDDFTRLITVLFIACLVFASCNFFVSRFSTRRPMPFCNTDAYSLDLLSGESWFCYVSCVFGVLEIKDKETRNEIVEWFLTYVCYLWSNFLCLHNLDVYFSSLLRIAFSYSSFICQQ